MPDHIRALVVILVLGTLFLITAKRQVTTIVPLPVFNQWRTLWFVLILLAFLAHNFWLYALLFSLFLLRQRGSESERVALFLFLLFAIPSVTAKLPGFGVINYLFELNHVRLLELLLLLPLFVGIQGKADTLRLGRTVVDKILLFHITLVGLLVMRQADASPTFLMRESLYLFLDVVVPYFIISRSLRTLRDFRLAMLAFVMAAMLLSLFLAFEAVWHWHLFRGMAAALGSPLDALSYMERSGLLRAMGTAGHPIVSGYVVVVAIGFYLFLFPLFRRDIYRQIGTLLLVLGLLATLSRGPWMGALAMLLVFVALGARPAQGLAKLIGIGMGALVVLSFLPAGKAFIDLLPFVGTVHSGSIDYRESLLEATDDVIMRNPLFGSDNFVYEPEMQALLQGQGIIDVVNTYLLMALRSGLVGVGSFILFFALVAWGVYKAMRGIADKSSEAYRLGRSILAALAAIMVIIFTVSPVSLVPAIYWCVAGIGVAYTQMVRLSGVPQVGARAHMG